MSNVPYTYVVIGVRANKYIKEIVTTEKVPATWMDGGLVYDSQGNQRFEQVHKRTYEFNGKIYPRLYSIFDPEGKRKADFVKNELNIYTAWDSVVGVDQDTIGIHLCRNYPNDGDFEVEVDLQDAVVVTEMVRCLFDSVGINEEPQLRLVKCWR